jgi:hypothetical protein
MCYYVIILLESGESETSPSTVLYVELDYKFRRMDSVCRRRTFTGFTSQDHIIYVRVNMSGCTVLRHDVQDSTNDLFLARS